MKSFRHRLPPLNSLLTFEAAARHANFTRAASELHITQAAVSRQIAILEHHIDAKLFHRHGRRVSLTAAGQQLSQRLATSFDFMIDALESVSRPSPNARLTLAANSAISHLWLGPMLNRLRATQPALASGLRLITADHHRDILTEDVDLAICYDMAPHPDWQLTPLFTETLYPVASPDFIAELPQGARDCRELPLLAALPLLDYERLEPNWINWPRWFSGMGKRGLALNVQRQFTSYHLVLDAALAGQGVALGSHQQVSALVARGQLVRLGTLEYSSGCDYWLAARLESQNPRQAALASWLHEQV